MVFLPSVAQTANKQGNLDIKKKNRLKSTELAGWCEGSGLYLPARGSPGALRTVTRGFRLRDLNTVTIGDLPARLDWSIIGCTILLLALMNLDREREREREREVKMERKQGQYVFLKARRDTQKLAD